MAEFEELREEASHGEAAKRKRLAELRQRIIGDGYDTESKLREALSRLLTDLRDATPRDA